jgi:hypothetical protein
MSIPDPNLEWLGHVQPIGLVVAPAVLSRHDLFPPEQGRADTEAATALLAESDDGPALADPWAFFSQILGWRPAQVAGAPGGPALPEDLSAWLPESETRLAPHWAVQSLDGGWQLLIRLEARGVAPDARGALEGWEATPHQRLERLLRETGVQTGLLLTDNELRVVHAPRGETSGWLPFPLRPLRGVAGRPMLGALKLLLSSFRLHNDAPDRRLPALLKASRDAQAEVSTKLASQVLGALHELLRGLHAADPDRLGRLAAQRPAHLYEGLLTVLLRLVFLLYAEDRDLVPSVTDAEARALYDQGYGVRALHARLLDDQARHPDTMDERRGAWSQLLALFRLIHGGHASGWIRGRGGKLFDPAVFPFLQGQDDAAGRPAPAPVSDGCILRVLDGLLTLDGERLSYRTLDVEQIGSVYETVMGFTVLALPGPALAIRAGKNNRTPVFLDLAALAAKKGTDRAKFLKEEADRGQVPARVAQALSAATTAAEVAEALRAIVDERGSPGAHTAPPGTPLLQPTDERRRTGSHYTPRSLTEPIVRHALEPAFERIGEAARPEEVLALKVCDPAMGSGAFLVEACRQLATRLVKAWTLHAGTRPEIPPDEDEDLLARRLVAQRCLYGVDKNPMATDLARLSLWLATLARDHEFTFLDHALKTGDSLVGLTRAQIGAMTWGDDRQDSSMSGFVRGRVAEAVKARAEIRDAPDDVARAIQEARHRALEGRMTDVRALGDAVLACFFVHDKSRAREGARQRLAAMPGGDDAMWVETRRLAATVGHGPHPIRPFHWEVEFPEVFAGTAPGFDAIVGNPPFAGKNTITAGSVKNYLPWLQILHEGAHGNADLVAHFFRRAFRLLRQGGVFGLIATNTIGQGDTRASGLARIIADGGAIARATRRLKWPGEAAVVVSVVHIVKGEAVSPVLDTWPVRRISAYLVEGGLDTSPVELVTNSGKAFQGSIVLGMGFTFDDAAAVKGKAETVAEMLRLVGSNSANGHRILPYIGGDEVANSPTHSHHRYVIDFVDFPLCRRKMAKKWTEMSSLERAECLSRGTVPEGYTDPVAEDWPDLLEILERRVKLERISLPPKNSWNRDVARLWWRFGARRTKLFEKISNLERVIAIAMVSPHVAFTFLPTGMIYSTNVTIISSSKSNWLCVLQSRSHEVWARTFSSTLEDRIKYAPSDAFRTFPFPTSCETDPSLEAAGEAYYALRAKLMIARNEGLTKTYNRFHARGENGADITRMRALHHELDAAVLRAYGWDDLADRAAPEFIEQEADEGKTPKTRLDWPSDFKDEVLARLLALNATRAAEERAAGLVAADEGDDQEIEEGEGE